MAVAAGCVTNVRVCVGICVGICVGVGNLAAVWFVAEALDIATVIGGADAVTLSMIPSGSATFVLPHPAVQTAMMITLAH
jgi:hypothetical protein